MHQRKRKERVKRSESEYTSKIPMSCKIGTCLKIKEKCKYVLKNTTQCVK